MIPEEIFPRFQEPRIDLLEGGQGRAGLGLVKGPRGAHGEVRGTRMPNTWTGGTRYCVGQCKAFQ